MRCASCRKQVMHTRRSVLPRTSTGDGGVRMGALTVSKRSLAEKGLRRGLRVRMEATQETKGEGEENGEDAQSEEPCPSTAVPETGFHLPSPRLPHRTYMLKMGSASGDTSVTRNVEIANRRGIVPWYSWNASGVHTLIPRVQALAPSITRTRCMEPLIWRSLPTADYMNTHAFLPENEVEKADPQRELP